MMVSGVARRALLGPQRHVGVANLNSSKSPQLCPTLPVNERPFPPIRPNTVTITTQLRFSSSATATKKTVPIQSRVSRPRLSPDFTSKPCLPSLSPTSPWRFPSGVSRHLSASQVIKNKHGRNESSKDLQKERSAAEQKDEKKPITHHGEGQELKADGPQEQLEFRKTETASQAAKINKRARLAKEGTTEPKKIWQSLGEVWRLVKIARPELPSLSVAFALLVTSSAITLGVPYFVGKIMDLATTTSAEETKLFGLTLYQFFPAFALFLSVGAAANFGRIILLRIIGERVVARLRSQLYRRTFSQDAEFFDANRVGDLISRLGGDTIIVGKSITQNASDGLRSFISSVAGISAMAWISPSLSSLLLVAAPFLGAGSMIYSKMIRKLSRQLQQKLGALTKVAEERLGNVKTSQAFVGEAREVGRYNKQVKEIFHIGKKQSLLEAVYFSFNGWTGNMMIVALLWVGGGMVRDGILSVGDLTTFMMYSVWAGGSFFGVANFLSELMKGVGAATRLFELQDRKPELPATPGVQVKSAQGPIRFSNVQFAYPTRPAVTIFKDVSFEIPWGSNVCIVGPSGGGKSTVSWLLQRFYLPTSGSISINGVDIATMNAKSLRRRIGIVQQEPVLFAGTIAENIAYGVPHATKAEIFAAASKANCSFLENFTDGLETQVGPRGAQLSGGQKQRIAIARALIKDPDILILDEATSALDAESETAVNTALAALLQGRNTTISIAHRLSTIKRSDQIIVLSKEGTVAEIGSYRALKANPESEFSKLMEWQASGGDVPDPDGQKKGPGDIGDEMEPEQDDDIEGGEDKTQR